MELEKTTLFRILTTLILPDKGSATIAGYDLEDDLFDIRRIAGYMPGRFSLYQDLSVEENIKFFATVFNTTVMENYDLIKDIYVQLEPFKKRRAGKLSGGMKQKLALCCALVHQPKVLFLDEPTTGVDPVSRREFWEMLDELKKKGISILVSTPYMDEAARCDEIALIQKGKILDIDSYHGLLNKHKKAILSVRGEHMHALLQDLKNYRGSESCFSFGDNHHLLLKEYHSDRKTLLKYLSSKGHTNPQIDEIFMGIEDIFMDLLRKRA